MNGVAKGAQSQKRDNTESGPSQTDSNGSSPIIITRETKFDREQLHTSNREHPKELPSIAGDTNSVRGEKHYCPPEQVLATHKRRRW
ncbi:unnamed protein product [Hymenolepis diminuta]|uniref:Uncharacterized protein n=1 Tax=Hymenolepis diminuta TaxID=6216 RepID=A0A564Y8W8_HYMDI|nr:unnamed protein product [Hymenolepis diminuta]